MPRKLSRASRPLSAEKLFTSPPANLKASHSTGTPLTFTGRVHLSFL